MLKVLRRHKVPATFFVVTRRVRGQGFIFEDFGRGFAETGTVKPDDIEAGDGFGFGLALEGTRLVATTAGDDSLVVDFDTTDFAFSSAHSQQ